MRKLSPLLFVILGVGLGFMVFQGAFGQGGAATRDSPGGSSGSAFTYQGRLEVGGAPGEGDYDFQFQLYDAPENGNQVGGTVSLDDVTLTNGLFSVLLDFGSGAFDGEGRWLEIAVREGTSSSAYSTLSPRQALTATPYALHADVAGSMSWSGLSGVPPGLDDGDDVGLTSVAWDDLQAVPAGFADGVDDVGPASVEWADVANRPAGLDDGDDDTTYSAGTGLALGGTQFSVLSGTVQMRVADVCAVGSTIQAIDADGGVVCAFADPLRRAAPPAANVRSVLDSAGDVGSHTSATIGSDGLPIIAYFDETSDDLKVAHCHDVACSGATTTTVDGGAAVAGLYSSATIGSDGLPLIGYFDNTSLELKLAHCHDPACSSASISTVAGASGVAKDISLMIGNDGYPFISYLTYDGLSAVHCDDSTCASAVITSLDSPLTSGQATSVAMGVDGLPMISYLDDDTNQMMVARCHVISCTNASNVPVDGSSVSPYNAIAIGSDGLPIIAYDGNGLKVSHCFDIACATSLRTVIDDDPGLVLYTSITIGSDGLAVISYFDATNNVLKVAHCNNLACTSASATTVDSAGVVGHDASVTIGVDGLPFISYRDVTNGDLKALQCSNPLCVPFFRRR